MLLKNLSRIGRCYVARFKSDQGIISEPLDIPYGESDMTMKSRVSFLSQDMAETDRTGIIGLSSKGFRMYDGSFLYGPIVVFPNVCLSWRVAKPVDITPESLRLFFMLQPRLDILVLGVGSSKNIDLIRKNVTQAIHKERIGLELLPTEDAIPTFNWLNSEYRSVAGCFYPVEDLKVSRIEHGRSLAALYGGRDRVVEPPHQMFTRPFDPVDRALHRIYYGDPAKISEARKLVDDIKMADIKMKQEKAKQERLQLASASSERVTRLEGKSSEYVKELEEEMEKQRSKKQIDDK